jgi:hypothetical protein
MGCQANVFKSIAIPSTYPICGDSVETIDSKSQTVSAVSNAKIQEEETNEDSVCPLPKELLLS